ncbi:hypothetical protein KAR91_06935 [Candidatus Pacearchaeota archaeon]|nr:hypothetical protein [Candidatus Pacearchaeota archaeon]
MYETNAICPECGTLEYDESREFTYCPNCGKKVKIVAHCLTCGAEGTEKEIHTHECRCLEHDMLYVRYGDDRECPRCRKARLEKELLRLKD